MPTNLRDEPDRGNPSPENPRPDLTEMLVHLPHLRQARVSFEALFAAIESNDPRSVRSSLRWLQRCGFKVEVVPPTRQWGGRP